MMIERWIKNKVATMVFFALPPVFKNWFEAYRSLGCGLLGCLGAYTLYMTVNRNRCIDAYDETEPILPVVMIGHFCASIFFLFDMVVLTLVKSMWRTDLFIHHCICIFLLVYFTIDFPLMGAIFYFGEMLTSLNFLRPQYPLLVTFWRLGVVLLIRFPVYGSMFSNVVWYDDFCMHHHKATELACSFVFFFIYDFYVIWGCIQAIIREVDNGCKMKKPE